ncbi:MAG: hypothetical protein GOV15_03585 [Candidatus Diapherotrites archaeon]|nr:hypothetical protein [Candidatus Diapherotrites archaeon]
MKAANRLGKHLTGGQTLKTDSLTIARNALEEKNIKQVLLIKSQEEDDAA